MVYEPSINHSAMKSNNHIAAEYMSVKLSKSFMHLAHS